MSDQTHVTSTTPLATAAAAEVTAPVVHGAVILSAVETAWREIRHRFTDVPDISVTVPPTAGVQDPTKCTALRTGRHFIRNGQPTMELQVSSGTLGLGGHPLVEGLLHHAAHGLALTRGINDTSSVGRWHNRRYGHLAREVGLTPPTRADKFVGLSHCPLADAESWSDVIAALDAAAAVQLRATVKSTAPRTGKGSYRFPIICECVPLPRRQHVTPFFFRQGPLLCGLCQAAFRPANDDVLHTQATEHDA